jgi:membrane complex biogenesis BtpA family protein
MDLEAAFGTGRPLIGVLHVPALPGSPANTSSFDEIRRWVFRDADALARGGIDAMIVENFGDTPFYPKRVPPHTIAFLSVLAREVKQQFRVPVGVNVLRNDGIGAIAVAAACGAEFLRVNVYTGARVTDQGIIEGEAHRIQRYRRLLASPVLVFADVAVKHSAALAPRPLTEEVREAVERGRADAVIVTGAGTGQRTAIDELRDAKEAAGEAPVFAGSGVDLQDAARVLAHADGMIVGTALKRDGVVRNAVDPGRVEKLVRLVKSIRG